MATVRHIFIVICRSGESTVIVVVDINIAVIIVNVMCIVGETKITIIIVVGFVDICGGSNHCSGICFVIVCLSPLWFIFC